jgi:hypothetical protein
MTHCGTIFRPVIRRRLATIRATSASSRDPRFGLSHISWRTCRASPDVGQQHPGQCRISRSLESSGAAARRRVRRSPRRALASAGPARHARAVPAGQEPQIDKVNPAGGPRCCGGRLPGFDCPAPGRRPKAACGVAARSAAPSLGPATAPERFGACQEDGEKWLTEESRSDLLGVNQSQVAG